MIKQTLSDAFKFLSLFFLCIFAFANAIYILNTYVGPDGKGE